MAVTRTLSIHTFPPTTRGLKPAFPVDTHIRPCRIEVSTRPLGLAEVVVEFQPGIETAATLVDLGVDDSRVVNRPTAAAAQYADYLRVQQGDAFVSDRSSDAAL